MIQTKNNPMKYNVKTLVLSSFILVSLIACKKNESGEYAATVSNIDEKMMVSDSTSMAASQEIEGKKFVKTADIDMEVKNVYDATMSIEKSLKELGGFVTNSRLQANTISEETYNTSDEAAILVRKYQNQNQMQVRVPTEKLADFLTIINDKKLFLNSRIITADDVSANIKMSELDQKRLQKTGENIAQLKSNKDKVNLADDNMNSANQQKIADYNLSDNLKYSTVNIFIKEPKTSVAEIPITNIKNIDNKYKSNFFYEMKNALIEGFYLIQSIIIFLISVWPLWLITLLGIFLYKNRKTLASKIKIKN